MADQEQLEILMRGVNEWNKWRSANPTFKIELSGANLHDADLASPDGITGISLKDADFREANLSKAHLMKADLRGADLRRTRLWGADLSGADLQGADLREADLDIANLWLSDLREADLSNSLLDRANLTASWLAGSTFARAQCGQTQFSTNDLSEVIDLQSIMHNGPSILGTDTLRLSKGRIPEAFLRGCGLSDWEIESAKLYTPALRNDEIIDIQNEVFRLLGQQPLQISSLFISYSHSDGDFVEKMEKYLNEKGIRFWRDVHDATAGRLEKVIDRAIRRNPTVLLVLSVDSVQSDWVEHEVNDARELEKEIRRDVLCPVALDDEWKNPNSWSQVLLEQVKKYHILDFSKWRDDNEFSTKFDRLVEGLELFYKK